MINFPSDYDSAQSFDGSGGIRLTVGGHVCKIINARVEKSSRTGKDMLVIAFDIAEGSEFDGYYKNRFDRAVKYNANATWPGVFRTSILNNENKTNGFFKGLIESIEESNSGFDFRATGGNEATLKGKFVGFNFGEEEFVVQNTGEVKTTVKPAYAVSVARVREGVIPPAIKKLDSNSGSGAGNPFASQSPRYEQTRMDTNGFTEVDDDELPF